MNLRSRIRLTALLVRVAGVLASALMWPLIGTVGTMVLSGLWLIVSGPWLRTVILPALFPSTTCPGCRRTIPLCGRWKCGGHYTDHQERHILTFHCNQGHLLEGFDCPRCQSTILVQYGEREVLRHGSAIRLRSIGQLPQHGVLIGHDDKGREVRIPPERMAWHMAITGGTGRGKSTLLANIAVQLMQEGSGLTLLDPGGDLSRQLRMLVPPEREQDVVYINVGDREHPFPLNILSAETAIEQAMLAEELIEVFRHMYGSSWGPVLEHQLRMAMRAVMSARGSLRDVYQLFTDAAHRNRLVGAVTDDAVRSFWMHEFPRIPEMRHSAVLNKLAPIVFHPLLGSIIGTRECGLNADDAISRRQIVLVNLATGSPSDDVTRLLGTFLVQKILAASFRQGRAPEQQRIPHVLIVDEFQRFMHRAAAFDQIITESRKYKLSLIVANQYVEQLDLGTRAALFGNVGALVAFRVGHRDAGLLKDEFTGSIIEDLMELELGRCLVRVGNEWNVVKTLPPPRIDIEQIPAPVAVREVGDASQRRPGLGQQPAATLQHLRIQGEQAACRVVVLPSVPGGQRRRRIGPQANNDLVQ